MIKNIVVLGIFFMCGTNLFAQDCKYIFKGKILDSINKVPIESASIYLKNLNKYTLSDKNGFFKLKGLCEESIELEIRHLACKPILKTIYLNDNLNRTFFLQHYSERLEEVILKSTENNTSTAQETVLKKATIEKYSSLSLGDALKEVSGVSSINTGNTIVKPVINGMHSSRVLILNNGVRLQDQEWGIEHAPNIDINSAGKVSVIKGSGALAYGGDAIGGVIVVSANKNIRKDTLFGRTIVGGQSNGRGYNISSTLNKNYKSGWFSQVQGSFKRNGDFNAPNYNLTNTGTNIKGFTTRFGKSKFKSGFEVFYSLLDSEIGILRSAHIGNSKSLANAINASRPIFVNDFSYTINPPKQEIIHHLIKTSYYKRLKKIGKLHIQYDYQNNHRFEFDIRRGGRSTKPAIDLNLQTHTVSLDVKKNNNLERKYNYGVLYRFQDHFASPDTGVKRLIPDYNKYDFGGYVATEWMLNSNLLLDVGLRYDFTKINAFKFYRTSFWNSRGYNIEFPNLVIEELRNKVLTNPSFKFHNLSSVIGLKHNFNNKQYILGNYSFSSRAPNPSELFSEGVHHSAARIEIGDIRFKSENSNRISTTYGYTGSKLNFQLESYYNKINNFIYLVPTENGIRTLIRGPFPEWEYIQTNAYFFGFDFTLNYQIREKLNFNHKSSLVKAYDKNANLPLINIPPFINRNGITYNNKKWKNFKATLNSELFLEQNEFPDEFNYTVPIANEEDIFVDLSPPPAYHLMHFQSEITLPAFKNSKLNIRFSIDNIFNISYRNYLNRLRFFADELGRNFKLQLQLNY